MVKYLILGVGCITYTSIICATTIFVYTKKYNKIPQDTTVASEDIVKAKIVGEATLPVPVADGKIVSELSIIDDIKKNASTTNVMFPKPYTHLEVYKKLFDIYIKENLKLLEVQVSHGVAKINYNYILKDYYEMALILEERKLKEVTIEEERIVLKLLNQLKDEKEALAKEINTAKAVINVLEENVEKHRVRLGDVYKLDPSEIKTVPQAVEFDRSLKTYSGVADKYHTKNYIVLSHTIMPGQRVLFRINYEKTQQLLGIDEKESLCSKFNKISAIGATSKSTSATSATSATSKPITSATSATGATSKPITGATSATGATSKATGPTGPTVDKKVSASMCTVKEPEIIEVQGEIYLEEINENPVDKLIKVIIEIVEILISKL